MSALAPADARRLHSSLARLASPHDGEILACVAAIGRILGETGLGFSDLGVTPTLPPPRSRSAAAGNRPEHQRRAVKLLRSGCDWSPWSREFLVSISVRRKALTEKQEVVLTGMEREAGMAETAA